MSMMRKKLHWLRRCVIFGTGIYIQYYKKKEKTSKKKCDRHISIVLHIKCKKCCVVRGFQKWWDLVPLHSSTEKQPATKKKTQFKLAIIIFILLNNKHYSSSFSKKITANECRLTAPQHSCISREMVVVRNATFCCGRHGKLSRAVRSQEKV